MKLKNKGCVGTVVLKEDKVLFVRQAKGHSLEGQWSIPWGIVEPGEYPEEAAVRETKEESSIDIRIEGLLGIQDLPEEGWIALVFLCHHLSGNPKPDGIETDNVAYLSLEEIERFNEPIEPWCKWLTKKVLKGSYTIIFPELDNPYKLLGFL